MIKYLFLCLLCFSICTFAQEGKSRYLSEDAVFLVNGEVIFERVFDAPGMSDEKLYGTLLEWAKIRFVTDEQQQSMVLLADKEKWTIACQGKEPLFFKRTGWVKDNAIIKFRLFIYMYAGKVQGSGEQYFI